jgi:hypothetical protein
MNRRTLVRLMLCALVAVVWVMSPSPPAAADDIPGRVIDRDVDLTGASQLALRASSQNVYLRTAPQPREGSPVGARVAGAPAGASAHVHVEVRGAQDELGAIEVQVARAADRVVITIEDNRERGRFSRSSSSDLSVSCEITVVAAVGLAVDVGSGNVVVDAAPGSLRIGSGSGNVLVNQSRGTVDAHTGSGNVVVRDAASSVRLHTSSGNVAAELGRNWRGDTVVIDTGSGNIRLAVPAGFRGDVRTNTSSGRVVEEVGIAPAREPSISLRTGSGNVRIVAAEH